MANIATAFDMSDQAQVPECHRAVGSLNGRRLGCLLISVSMMAGLSGCATEPEVAPTSAAYYELFDCTQLVEHARNVSVTAAELAGLRPHQCLAATRVVIFWPAAFERNFGGPQGEELSKLKSEFEAVQQSSLQKNCSIQFQPQLKPNSEAAC
jgi:hypothetical protein